MTESEHDRRGEQQHLVLGRLMMLFTGFIASSMVQRDDYVMIVLQSPLDDPSRERLRRK